MTQCFTMARLLSLIDACRPSVDPPPLLQENFLVLLRDYVPRFNKFSSANVSHKITRQVAPCLSRPQRLPSTPRHHLSLLPLLFLVGFCDMLDQVFNLPNSHHPSLTKPCTHMNASCVNKTFLAQNESFSVLQRFSCKCVLMFTGRR